MKRVAGYVRVSSEMQLEGHSLAAQRRAIEEACAAEGHTLVEVYADEGVSAHTDVIARRPAFARLLADAERGRFDVVMVHELSRWARNGGVCRETLTRLGRADVGFVSLLERMDFTSPVGKMTLAVMAASHELSSDLLAQHVTKSLAERARQGLPVGLAPFGYRNDAGAAVVHEDEAEALREAYRMRARGLSYQRIADWLSAFGYRTRRGNAFTSFAVKDLLAGRFCLGVVTFEGREYPGRHAAIVARELWHAAAARRGRPRVTVPRVARGALAGRARCTHCERPLTSGTYGSGRSAYRERHGQPCRTLGRSTLARPLDEQMGEIFGAMVLDDETLAEALAAARRALTTAEDVDRLHDERRRLVRASLVPGALSDEEYEERMASLDARLRAATSAAAPPIEEAYALVRDLPRLWDAATDAERRELLGAMVEEVYVDIERREVSGIRPVAGLEALLRAAWSAARKHCSDVAVVLVETRGTISLVPPPTAGGVWSVQREAA